MTIRYGGNADELDRFFTPRAVARRCWDFFHEQLDVPTDARYVEPSAGAGAFLDLMPEGRARGFDLDVQPEVEGRVTQGDFLALDPLAEPLEPGFYVVGNPPFGPQGASAVLFINHCFALGAAAVGMVLPSTFLPSALTGEAAIERSRLLGCHSVASLANVTEKFEIPGRAARPVLGCCFVVYRPGARRGRARELPTCSTWAKVSSIRDKDDPNIAACDMFLQCNVWDSQIDGGFAVTRTLEEQPYAAGVSLGIRIHRRRDEIEQLLREFDWRSVAKLAANKSWNLSVGVVRKVITDAGYVDGDVRPAADAFKLDIRDPRLREKAASADYLIRREYFSRDDVKVLTALPEGGTKHNHVGIRLHRRDAAVRRFIEQRDWWADAKQSNAVRALTIGAVEQALIDAGFVDDGQPDRRPADPDFDLA